MTLAFPHLWIPPRDLVIPKRAWWQRIPGFAMAANVKLCANAKQELCANAKRKLCTPCSVCADITDATIQISGITLCGCVDLLADGFYYKFDSNPNGTYSGFSNDGVGGGFCTLSKTTSITISRYSNSGCTTLVSSSFAKIFLQHDGSKWSWIIRNASSFSGIAQIYAGGGGKTANLCDLTVTGIADLATSSSNCADDGERVGYGGTADIAFSH